MSDDGPPLAALQQGLIDSATLLAYRDELHRFAHIEQVLTKGGARDRANGSCDLDASIAALHSGAVHGIQIGYRYAGQHWLDTVLRRDGGFLIVRSGID